MGATVTSAGFLERADPCASGLWLAAIFGPMLCGDAIYVLLAQLIVIAAWFDAGTIGARSMRCA